MAAKLLEGKPVAEQVLNDVARRGSVLRARGVVPGLATLLVGDDPASAGYVRKKQEACARAGLRSVNVALPPGTTQAELHASIQRLNADPAIHAFLLQHPLPAGLDFGRALLEMDPRSWRGPRLLPDVAEAVGEKAAWITPRLGGVGVTTVAMLLQNTVQLAELHAERAR